jgi:hypothetical protein
VSGGICRVQGGDDWQKILGSSRCKVYYFYGAKCKVVVSGFMSQHQRCGISSVKH